MEPSSPDLQRFREAAKRPILGGWLLWLRTLPASLVALCPLALLAGAFAVGWFPGVAIELPGGFWLRMTALAVLLIYGFARVSVEISDAHVGLANRGAFGVPIAPVISWAATITLVSVVSLAGLALLILPGVILWARLCWAAEYALVYGMGPFAACRASWDLTEGKAVDIFGFQFLLSLAENLPWIVGLLVFAGTFRVLTELSLPDDVFEWALATVGLWWLLVLYGSFHAPEVVYFYGMRARQRASGIGSEDV